MFAIFIGVLFISATLVITDTVRSGFSSLFSDVYRDVSVVVQEKPEVLRQGETFRGRIDGAIAETLKKSTGVAAVSPRVYGYAYVVNAEGLAPPNIGSDSAGPPIAENWIDDAQLNPYSLITGKAPTGTGEVVIDRGTAKTLSIDVGENIRIVSREGTSDGRVVGIVRFGAVDSPGAVPVVLFTNSDAERLLGEPGRVDALFVRATAGTSPETLAPLLQKRVPTGVEAITGKAATKERENAVASGLRFITAFLLIFAVLSLVVGAFLIANTFAISISQRAQELALIRAIGGSRAQVVRMTLGEAMVMAVVGAVGGLFGGIALASGLRSILRVTGVDLPPSPLVVRTPTILWALGIGIIGTLLAALAPALRAGRISPVAAMRESQIEPAPLLRRTVSGLLVAVVGAYVMRAGALAPNLTQTGLGVAVLFAGVLLTAPAISTVARFLVGPTQRFLGTTNGLAVRNATRNPRRTASTALALSLGSAVACFALILNASLSSSLKNAVRGGLRGDLVVRSGTFGVGGLPTTLAGEIEKLPSVEAVSGLRYGFATVDGPKRKARKVSAVSRTGGRPIASLDPRYADRLLDFGNVVGSFGKLGNGTIAVSQRELDDRGWKVGDALTLNYPGQRKATFTINTVFRTGLAFDFAIAHADYEPLSADQFDFVEYVAAKPGTKIDTLRADLAKLVTRYPTAKIEDPQSYVQRITKSLDQLLSLIFGLLVLVVVVAVLGIAITLSLSVVERLREIGMLRTLGMHQGQLRAMLRSEAIVISLIAVTIGVGLGVAAGWALLRALRDEGLASFAVPPRGILGLAILAAVAGLLASIIPAKRAARIPMLRALNGIRSTAGAPRPPQTPQQRHRRNFARVLSLSLVLLTLLFGTLIARRVQRTTATSSPPSSSPPSGTGSSTDTSRTGSTASTGPIPPSSDATNEPYAVPAVAGEPKHGRLLSATSIEAPAGLKGWRVLFDSTNTASKPTVVSGLAFVPDRAAPVGGWPVLSFAHPTTGLADRCAPSKAPGILETTVATLAGQINMAVVLSDYEGLGTAGLHPFLDGVSAGRTVLDATLAAPSIEGVVLSKTTALWGHSQGGHAALFAAQEAPMYAPELDVKAVVAGAPPSQLSAMVDGLQKTADRGYTLLVARGLQASNPALNLDDVLTTRAQEVAKRLDTQCSSDVIDAVSRDTLRTSTPLPKTWTDALAANEPGRRAIKAPVLIIHGDQDSLVPVESSAILATQLTALGTNVERKVYTGAGHADVALTSLSDVLAWTSKHIFSTAEGQTVDTVSAAGTVGAVAAAPAEAELFPGARGALREALLRGQTRPLVIAHAGGELEAPHSTPYAFDRSMKLGVDVLEMDVQLSKDGVLMVQHDPTLDRTSNRTGPVSAHTASELATFDNANWFTGGCWDCRSAVAAGAKPPFRGVRTGTVPPPAGYVADDFRIATLDDVLKRFPEVVIDIEIKTDGEGASVDGLAVARALAKRVEGDPARDRFVVVSFDDAALTEFRRLAPGVATSPGFGEISRYVLGGMPLGKGVPLLQVPPSLQGLPIFTKELRAQAAKDGIAIWVWPSDSTTDDTPNYKALLADKPNGIIAGRPADLKSLVP